MVERGRMRGTNFTFLLLRRRRASRFREGEPELTHDEISRMLLTDNHIVNRDISRDFLSRAEALAILAGDDEGFDHFGVDEVAVELIQLAQPEVVTVEV